MATDERAAAPLEVLRDLWLELGGEGKSKARASTFGDRDLTARQMAIFLLIHVELGPHTIRGLAVWLQTPKPTITRSVDRLALLGLVVRRPDFRDRRSILVCPTPRGERMLKDMCDMLPSRVQFGRRVWSIEPAPIPPLAPRAAAPDESKPVRSRASSPSRSSGSAVASTRDRQRRMDPSC